jgi:dTMP kinase
MRKSKDRMGHLICFEGGDAAGKTTLAANVAQELNIRGMNPVLVDKKNTEGYGDPFLRERMADLRRVLWDYPQEAPLGEWGDLHWFHLIVSWFSVLDRCRIRPLLERGELVIVDNWYYKFAARFLLKPELDAHFVLSSFKHLTVPDLVLFVDVDPSTSVTRRQEFSATESGKLDGGSGGLQGFVTYQNLVLEKLRSFSCGLGWVRFDATQMRPNELSTAAADLICPVALRNDRDNGKNAVEFFQHLSSKSTLPGRGRLRRRKTLVSRSQISLFSEA